MNSAVSTHPHAVPLSDLEKTQDEMLRAANQDLAHLMQWIKINHGSHALSSALKYVLNHRQTASATREGEIEAKEQSET